MGSDRWARRAEEDEERLVQAMMIARYGHGRTKTMQFVEAYHDRGTGELIELWYDHITGVYCEVPTRMIYGARPSFSPPPPKAAAVADDLSEIYNVFDDPLDDLGHVAVCCGDGHCTTRS